MNELYYVSLFHSYLATALIEQGKLEEAEPLIVQALKISRSRHISPCIGFALVALGHLRLARAFIQKAQNVRHTTATGYSKKQFDHLLSRARTTLQHALTFDGLESDTTLHGQLLLAKIFLMLGETEKASESSKKSIRRSSC